MLWHWISIDPKISSFSDIGDFKVCLNFVPIDTIFIIHVIDDITQSMKLFDGPRIGEIESILNSRDQEARGVVYLWAEKWLSRQEGWKIG